MEASNNGLLFYLSGDKGFDADFAKGQGAPAFLSHVDIIDGGAVGRAFRCDDYQKMAYRAPGNIYADRGTLSFFWRSRYPVGPTEFPIFRVGYADHSSWDACWLRVDYNGSGFEAFITDVDLSRARVAAKVSPFPAPERWTHLAVTWDESYGVRLYVDGSLAAEEHRPGVYATGLDQFGPHSRIISHWQVQSDYNFVRGGDIDEIAIFDHALADGEIALLAKGVLPAGEASAANLEAGRKIWMQGRGFGDTLPGVIPDNASVRKVEIHDAYDHKRWWWKALDGIAETSWPGVFNRSRLKGRNDYFQLPDWDCYSVSGKSITFHMPPEPYNHIEIAGSAEGVLEREGVAPLFARKHGAERSSHDFGAITGGKLRFTNELIEEPIRDFSAAYVTEGKAPEGARSESFALRPGYDSASPREKELAAFIEGRYQPYERAILSAVKDGGAGGGAAGAYPFVQIIVPYEFDPAVGLDGVELSLPAMELAGKGGLIALSVEIKDPLWYYRNLIHFSFSVEKGRGKTVWFDLRDRILPKDRCLYLTIASAEAGFGPESLLGASVRLVYKPREEAKAEHVADRFIQVRDCYGHLVEEQPGLPEFNLYNRFMADAESLLDANPEHVPGRYYYYDKAVLSAKYKKGPERPDFDPGYKTSPVPEGVPAWAWKQVEYLRHYKRIIHFYIDDRQIDNGELGGGLSDDGDFTAMFVGLANMTGDREKIKESQRRCLDAFYEQGMFTNGLPSIQTDELHSAEEGLIALGQALTIDFANPTLLERAMETARSLWWLTGVNEAGNRLIRSSYYSGSKMATEWPWGLQRPYSSLAISPASYLVRYNGNEKLKKLWVELADGLMAHRGEDGQVYPYIRFDDDSMPRFAAGRLRENCVYILLYTAFRFTGDRKYFDAIPHGEYAGDTAMFGPELYGKFLHTALSGVPVTDKAAEAEQYEALNYVAGIREYYNTEGHPWIDRVYFDVEKIQYDRLGGVSHKRGSCVYPMNRVRWEFENSGDDEKLAILSPSANDSLIKLVVHNLSGETVNTKIVGVEVLPGTWELSSGIDTDGDDIADEGVASRQLSFERSTGFRQSFAPGTTVVTLRLLSEDTGYWERPDLGISREDVRFYAHGMNVRVHSLGAVDTPPSAIALKSAEGMELKRAELPPIEAPADLLPRSWDVIFNLHGIPSLEGCYLELDPDRAMREITRENNVVRL